MSVVWSYQPAAGAAPDKALTADAAIHEIRPRWITPHLEWGKPLARGKLRVCFIVPESYGGREVIELWERLDMDYDGTTVSTPGCITRCQLDKGRGTWYAINKGTSLKERVDDIVYRLSKKHDVIVLGNVKLIALPAEAQMLILKQVAAGAGLVITYGHRKPAELFAKPIDTNRDFILAGIPLAGLPYYSATNQLSPFEQYAYATTRLRKKPIFSAPPSPYHGKSLEDISKTLVSTYAFGQGRIVVLDYLRERNCIYFGMALFPDETVIPEGWRHRVEYHASLVAKAVLWAAGRNEAHWEKLPAEPTVINRSALPADIAATLLLPENWNQLTAEATIRDRSGMVAATNVIEISPAGLEVHIPIRIPVLKEGRHYVDLVVSCAQGRLQWAGFTLEITGEKRITAMTTDQLAFPWTGNVSGTIGLTGPVSSGDILRIGMSDFYGRLIRQKDLALSPDKTNCPYSFPAREARSIPVTIRADWISGNEIASSTRAQAIVSGRPNWKFPFITFGNFTTYDGSDMMIAQLGKEQMWNMGVTHTLGGYEPWLAAMADFNQIVYATRITDPSPVGDPQALNTLITNIQATAVYYSQYGVNIFSLGDENCFSYNISTNALRRQAFVDYLQKQYASLAELNAAWNTSFNQWPDVLPEAATNQPFARQYDWNSFCEYQYAAIHHALANGIRAVVTNAIVGAEGSVPGDIELTVKDLDLWSPYGGNDILFQSVIKDRKFFPYGGWWGGYHQPTYSSYAALWPQMLSGAVNANYVYVPHGQEGWNVFSCDLSYADPWETYLPQLAEIQGGLGQLFAAGDPLSDEVAVYYSRLGYHAGMLGASPFGAMDAETAYIAGQCKAIGMTPFMLTDRMIRDGRLDHSAFKILFVLNAGYISDVELKAFDRFVRRGGVLVANQGIGLTDRHCKPARQKEVEAFFGFSREQAPQATFSPIELNLPCGSARLQIVSREARIDASITALATIPPAQVCLSSNRCAAITREVGKGRIIFINSTIASLGLTAEPAQRNITEQLLAVAGIEPPLRIAGDQPTQVHRVALGDRHLLGIIRGAPYAGERQGASGFNLLTSVIHLAKEHHIYDLRRGCYLGHTNRLELAKDTPPYMAISLSPYPVPPPKLSLSSHVKRGAVLKIDIALPGVPATHVGLLRLDLITPTGKPAAAYTDIVRLEGKETQTAIPLALNDEIGTWTVKVKDVSTGAVATERFQVE